jgi:hypothetical protein
VSNHYFSASNGLSSEFAFTSITKGTSSSAGDPAELRLADAAGLTRQDVKLFLKRLRAVFADGGNETDFPPL